MKMEGETTSFRLPSDAFNFDTELFNYALESVKGDSLLPLIKDELRCKIQTKRLSRGMEELKVDFQMKPPAPLTPEEKQKQENRKLLNRESAKKCRRKKKINYQNIQQELKSLMDENKHLKENIRCIEAEKDFFLSNILRHPVISEVLSDFSKSFDNNLTDIKKEIIYVQN